MRVLLTGSGGFIGRHLVAALGESMALLTPRSHELDLLDGRSVDAYFAAHGVDFIVHSAAVGVRITADAPEQVAEANLRMFETLAAHATASCPMLVLGSGAEYDKRRPLHKVQEEAWLEASPVDPYGKGKHAISRAILGHGHICNLRIFGIYGMHEHPSRLPAYVLAQCRENKDILLNQDVVFDFLYVKDLCRIVGQLLSHIREHGVQEKFLNACPDESISIKALAELAASLFPNYTGKIGFKQGGMGMEYSGSNQKLRSLLGGFDFTSYRGGLLDYLADLGASRG